MQIRQEEKLLNSNRHYSLRKLSVGLASVLIGISFLNGTKTTVKADTIANKNDEYAKAHEHNESSESMQAALLKNTGVAEGDSVQTGEASKAGNLEVAGNSKDLSAFSMPFNGKNDGNETAKADTTSDQTTQTSDAQTMATQNEKQQASSAQNSAAELQKDLLANTGNNQAEANNQENRLTDQINYKLANQDGTDNKKDSGQNLTVPEATKQVPTTKSDAEKSIAGSSSTQQVNNPSSNHAEDSSQTQLQNSKKLDLTKNRQFAKKVLAVNLIETNSSPTTNGGFDEATWGKLDVNNWQGSAQDGVYELTGYTGDLNHIIVPNKADFEQAGKSTNGLQVGITCDTIKSLFSGHSSDQGQRTIAFSKTNDQKVKAIGTDWTYAFDSLHLSEFDGSNLDVSGVTNMNAMFEGNKINDLTSLTNWDVSSVTNMSYMFFNNSISDLRPLANWNIGKVVNMSGMFADNKISDLTPLTNWKTSSVTNMSGMFSNSKRKFMPDGSIMFIDGNSISDLAPLTNWDVGNVTNMGHMFEGNKISNLTPLTNWNISKVTNMSGMFIRNSISDLKPLANWNTGNATNMRSMFAGNKISDLRPLANWNIGKVVNMSGMFADNKISDLTPLTNWNIGKVVNMSGMFADNKISDLTPLTNWKTSSVTNMSGMFSNSKRKFMPDGSIMFIDGNSISDLAPLTNWNISKVTNMSGMFIGNSISDLTPLKNWNISKVTNIGGMFSGNSISDLRPLANWNTGNATNMSGMFGDNKISDLKPLANWNTGNVTYMSDMFSGNKISDLTPLTNWDTSKVTNMNYMFTQNPNLKDIKAIANWNMSNIDDWYSEGLFVGDTQLDLTNTDMQAFLKKHGMSHVLQGSTFLTNDVDFVKANIGKTLPTLTNTATRTILFNFPDGTSNKITQTIYYKTLAPAQIYWPASTGGRVEVNAIVLNPPLLAENTPIQAGPDGLTPVDPDDPNPSNPYNLKLIKIYTENDKNDIKASDWQLDTSKQNDAVIIDGVINFKPVKIPYVNGYRPYIIKDPVNPTALLVSFFALPRQSQKTQSTSNEPQSVQSSQKNTQAKHKQSEPAEQEQKDKQVDQGIDYISDTLMHNSSSNADSLEPAQGDSTSIDNSFDSTQNGDAAKNQKVNTAKHKKHIVKKRAIKRRRKHTKKYRLKCRSRKHTKHSRKHTKRSRHAKKRIIKHRKSVSRKFRKFHLKHIKKA